jgi:hypothetical protein
MTHARTITAVAALLATLTLTATPAAAQDPKSQDAKVSIDEWPQASQKAYKEMQQKYGDPDGVTSTRIVWTNKGPFKEIILINEPIDHNFPKPHTDVLEHVIAYDVPVDKVGDLARFDGSVIVDRTRGTLSARCDSEAHNLVALNLAHEVIQGKKSVDEARAAYTEAARMEMQGQTGAMAKQLQFQPQQMAKGGDPDQATLSVQSGESGDQAQPAAGQSDQRQ